MKSLLAFLFLIFAQRNISAQQNSPQHAFREFNFITHLAGNKLFSEAEDVRSVLFGDATLPLLYRDSVNFFLGKLYISNDQRQRGQELLLEVSQSAAFYYNARYTAALLYADRDPAAAMHIIENLPESDNTTLNELQRFEMAGLQFLIGSRHNSDSLLAYETAFSTGLLQGEMQQLRKIRAHEVARKRKSPFLAGSLSAIVPGLGKVYVGNNGQALSAFLSCALFGGIAVENGYRLGIYHPQTILFAGVFSAFYIGNIWGSAVSVHLIEVEKNLEKKHNILFSLRLPVSTFFN